MASCQCTVLGGGEDTWGTCPHLGIFSICYLLFCKNLFYRCPALQQKLIFQLIFFVTDSITVWLTKLGTFSTNPLWIEFSIQFGNLFLQLMTPTKLYFTVNMLLCQSCPTWEAKVDKMPLMRCSPLFFLIAYLHSKLIS